MESGGLKKIKVWIGLGFFCAPFVLGGLVIKSFDKVYKQSMEIGVKEKIYKLSDDNGNGDIIIKFLEQKKDSLIKYNLYDEATSITTGDGFTFDTHNNLGDWIVDALCDSIKMLPISSINLRKIWEFDIPKVSEAVLENVNISKAFIIEHKGEMSDEKLAELIDRKVKGEGWTRNELGQLGTGASDFIQNKIAKMILGGSYVKNDGEKNLGSGGEVPKR